MNKTISVKNETRKNYKKPAMKVVKLKQRTNLLQGSNGEQDSMGITIKD